MNQVVRKTHIKDLSQINYLVKYSARVIQVRFYKESTVETALELISNIESLIEEGSFFIVEFENKVIACGGVELSKMEPYRAEIKSFFVHPDFVRKGLATKLLEVCEEHCLRACIKYLYLTATLAGEPFYKRCGFIELLRLHQPLSNGDTFELVKMQKELQA